jgi:predicted HD superfamily hydrolase involved in NAD metabolism
MRTAVLILPFDPVTRSEIRAARALVRQEHLSMLCLCPAEEGVLPRKQRLALLQAAVRPYRKLRAADAPAKNGRRLDADGLDGEEALVRSGSFDRAAAGTVGMLLAQKAYLDPILDACCPGHRADHSRSVAEVCVTLAKAHGIDPGLAWQAGMLHDITKHMDPDEAEAIMRICWPGQMSLSPKIWHCFTAVTWLRQNLGLHDERVLNAIWHHTLGDGQSDLDRILYIADKIEPTRGYDTSAELALSLKNLKQGAQLVKARQQSYLMEKEGIHD